MRHVIYYSLWCVLSLLCFTNCNNTSKTLPKDETKIEIDNDSIFYIPFVKLKDEIRIVITVRINNKVDAKLIVDNGIYSLHLSESFAQKHARDLEMTLYPNIQSIGSFHGSETKSYIAKGSFYFHVKDSVFKTVCNAGYGIDDEFIFEYADIVPDNQLQYLWDNELIDGVLPLEALAKQGIVLINNEKKRIEFPKKVDSIAIPYPYKKLQDGRQIVSFPLLFEKENKKEKFIFETSLDLGSSSRLFTLFQNSKIKTIVSQLKLYTITNFINNDAAKEMLFFNHLYAGGEYVIVKDVAFLQSPKDIIDLWLGISFLSHYNIYFDYSKQIIYLKSIQPSFSMADTNSILYGSLGIRKVSAEGFFLYEIMAINPNNIKINLQVGDQILRINDRDISKCSTILSDQSDTFVTVVRNKDTLTLFKK
ncbi:MAG: hypothetical protein FWC10_09845 [Lentimicrobiaceae bacterium]|nr:hypothetical protein [Lentimicrobiaceae bacterium]